MEQIINQDSVYAFLKLVTEFGGAYYVDMNQIILTTSDNSPIGVAVGKKTLPVALFKDGMKVGNYVVLNPLVETLGKAPEREWFFQSRQLLIGGMLKQLFTRIVEIAIDKGKDTDYEKLDLVTAFYDKLDEKMLKEIDRIKVMEWAYIFYDKATHTAQLQSDIFNTQLQESLGNKIRKQSWEVFRGLMALIFGTDDIEAKFTFTSANVAIPKADAIFHIMSMAANRLNPHVKKILNVDLHPQVLASHLEHLEKYQKLIAWFATGTSAASVSSEKPAVPWGTAPTKTSTGVPLPEGANIGPVGIPTNGVIPGTIVPAESTPITAPITVPVASVPVPVGFTPAPLTGMHFGQPVSGGCPVNGMAPVSVMAGNW